MSTLQAGADPGKSGSRSRCAPTFQTFGVLADSVNADPSLKPSDKVVLLALYRFGRFKGECFPAVGTLARASGVCDRTVRRCLGRLQEAGYIATRPTADNPTGRVIQCLWLADPKRHPVRRTEGQEAVSRTSGPGPVSRTRSPQNSSEEQRERKKPVPPSAGRPSSSPVGGQNGASRLHHPVLELARSLGAGVAASNGSPDWLAARAPADDLVPSGTASAVLASSCSWRPPQAVERPMDRAQLAERRRAEQLAALAARRSGGRSDGRS